VNQVVRERVALGRANGLLGSVEFGRLRRGVGVAGADGERESVCSRRQRIVVSREGPGEAGAEIGQRRAVDAEGDCEL